MVAQVTNKFNILLLLVDFVMCWACASRANFLRLCEVFVQLCRVFVELCRMFVPGVVVFSLGTTVFVSSGTRVIF